MTDRQWTVHRYVESDEDALLKLLALEYSGSDLTQVRFFRWQYEQNPAGRALIWVAKERESGEMVGQFWVLPMRVQVHDQIFTGSFNVNVVVHPSYRKQGMATILGKSVFADCPSQKIDLTYAIPSPATFHLDTIVFGSKELGQLPLLIRPLDWEALAAYRFSQAWLKRLVRTGEEF